MGPIPVGQEQKVLGLAKNGMDVARFNFFSW